MIHIPPKAEQEQIYIRQAGKNKWGWVGGDGFHYCIMAQVLDRGVGSPRDAVLETGVRPSARLMGAIEAADRVAGSPPEHWRRFSAFGG